MRWSEQTAARIKASRIATRREERREQEELERQERHLDEQRRLGPKAAKAAQEWADAFVDATTQLNRR